MQAIYTQAIYGKGSATMRASARVHTRYGEITATHVLAGRRRRLGHSRAAIPLGSVTSVRQAQTSRPGLGLLLLLAASACYPALDRPAGIAAALLLSAAGALCLWGVPTVVIRTTDGASHRVSGPPWSIAEADRFVAALRRARRAAGPSPATQRGSDTWWSARKLPGV